jgi:uncharacterized membrane protein YtjA (UPF0391 family)
MLNYALILLLISLVAGAVGLTNVSAIAKRIAIVLFGLFFLGFLALLALAYLLGAAFHAGQQAFLPVPIAKVRSSRPVAVDKAPPALAPRPAAYRRYPTG